MAVQHEDPTVEVAVPDASIASRLGRFASGLSYADIPASAIAQAKRQLLDSIGIALASSSYEFGRKAAGALAAFGPGDTPVIGLPQRLAVRDAILVNGILVHGIDYDDSSVYGRVHPSSFCAPTALTLSAARGLSGKDLLTGYVAGLEASIRIGAASKGGFPRNGFDAGGIVGAFGACFVASRLLGLTPEQFEMAQGVAYSMASGNREFIKDMAWTKRLHPGWAGVGGTTAAILAQGGFVGPGTPYEGKYGLFRQYTGPYHGDCDLSLATEALGEDWLLESVGFKPLPACYFNIGSIDAATTIARKHKLKPEEIASVEVLLPQAAVDTVCEPKALKRHPTHGYAGEFSIYYTVAAALTRGSYGLGDLDQAAIEDPVVRDLASRVDYRVDPETTFPKFYSGAVIVTTRDGRRFEEREDVHRGSADRPLSNADLTAKFLDNAGRVFDRAHCESICEKVLDIQNCADVGTIAEVIAAPK